MSIVTIKVVRTERIEDDGLWDRDQHTLTVRYAGRIELFRYSTGLAFEGRVSPADWLSCVALDVQTANAGLEEFAACYGESVEDCREDFAAVEAYANRAKRLFGDDIDDLDGWVDEDRSADVTIYAGQSASLDLAGRVYQQQLFRM